MLHKGKYCIVGFGNSLTHGYLVKKGYLDYLYEYLYPYADIINSGIPGDTIIDASHRLDNSVLKYNPDITIIEFAINDAFSGITIANFEKIYENLLKQINNVKIIMIPHLTEDRLIQKYVKPYYEILKKIAVRHNLSLIDISVYILKKNELLSDMIHPNEKGYQIYAQVAFNILKEYIPEIMEKSREIVN